MPPFPRSFVPARTLVYCSDSGPLKLGAARARSALAERDEERTDLDELARDTQRQRLAARDAFIDSCPRAETMAAL
jgi:hypothetical protein